MLSTVNGIQLSQVQHSSFKSVKGLRHKSISALYMYFNRQNGSWPELKIHFNRKLQLWGLISKYKGKEKSSFSATTASNLIRFVAFKKKVNICDCWKRIFDLGHGFLNKYFQKWEIIRKWKYKVKINSANLTSVKCIHKSI